MYVGGGWGDAIYIFNDENTRIYGFKDPWRRRVVEGSVLFNLADNRYNDTIPLYYVSNVEYKDDPKDMFFADIELIGNVENPKTEDYEPNWYKPYIDKVEKELVEKRDKTNFFNFGERVKLKKFIETLNEMKESR